MILDLRPLAPLEQRIEQIEGSIASARHRALFRAAVDRIDPHEYAELQHKWRDDLVGFDPKFIFKYFDVCFWIKDKIVRAERVGLFDRTPARVLDLGTGAGHFPAVCAALGHEVIGLDIEAPLYADLARLMKVDRRFYRIAPRRSLPDLGRFDVITGLAVSFDSIRLGRKEGRRYWSPAEWAWFLAHVSGDHARYPGRLYLELNLQLRPNRAPGYDEPLLAACASAGAEVEPAKGRVCFAFDGPIVLDMAAWGEGAAPADPSAGARAGRAP